MKLRVAIFVAVLLATATVMAGVRMGLAQQLPEGAEFAEIVMVDVNCTKASMLVASGVMSNNTELVHFPAEINMNAAEWENVTQVMVGFSTADSFLFYIFNNTSEDNAESIANTLTNQLNTVFGTSFGHNSTYQSNGYVNVTYAGVDVANLTQYTEWLMQDCLASDLGGFSLTFIPMTKETSAYTVIMAQKESGGFNWTYVMGVMYYTSITEGTGEHTIDILDLLNVESLAPSNYSLTSIPEYPYPIYVSIVMLNVISDTSVTFVSCRPDQASPPNRGWYISPQIWPTQLEGVFSFGGDKTPANELWLTFSGTVIPEFAASILMAVSTIATTITVFIKKRFKRQ